MPGGIPVAAVGRRLTRIQERRGARRGDTRALRRSGSSEPRSVSREPEVVAPARAARSCRPRRCAPALPDRPRAGEEMIRIRSEDPQVLTRLLRALVARRGRRRSHRYALRLQHASLEPRRSRPDRRDQGRRCRSPFSLSRVAVSTWWSATSKGGGACRGKPRAECGPRRSPRCSAREAVCPVWAGRDDRVSRTLRATGFEALSTRSASRSSRRA